ncbi:hypothetical protein HYW75_06155 [Candidatus Pacearchaeota archaeon]|nr:hypothetical protein [Candidatus Pacearchaeota archaeon]
MFRNHVNKIPQGGKMAKPKMEFFDVKTKNKFQTEDYKIVERSGRFFAVAKSPTGTHECWRVVSKDAAAKLK